MEIESDKVEIEILHKAAGPISESDVLLCSASDGIIIGFGVKVENKALKLSKQESVEIRLYSVIYELIDQIKEAMLGMLDTETREKVLGRAEVKQVFKIKRGRVGGCIVNEGLINRNARARVIRQGQAVYDGGFQTLKSSKMKMMMMPKKVKSRCISIQIDVWGVHYRFSTPCHWNHLIPYRYVSRSFCNLRCSIFERHLVCLGIWF